MMDILNSMDTATFVLGMLFAYVCDILCSAVTYFLEKSWSLRAECRKCKREQRRKQKQEKEKTE